MGRKVKLQCREYEKVEGDAVIQRVVEQDFTENLSKDLRVGLGLRGETEEGSQAQGITRQRWENVNHLVTCSRPARWPL